MSIRQLPSNDEMEIAESKNPLVDLLYDYTAQAMATRVGSYLYHRFDTCLSVVEKTAKWSLPQSPSPSEEDSSKINISPPPLIRPLPWILFLPALIALRLIRASLSLIALIIGKQPVYPVTMVSFLQSRRRKLRALKYRGQKIQRMKRAEKESEKKSEAQAEQSWLEKITLPLRYMVCLKTVRPGTSINPKEGLHHHHHHRHRQSRDLNKKATNKARAKSRDEPESGKKRNAHERDAYDSESSTDATIQELLEKYANDAGDSSYHVNDTALSESDSFETGSDQSRTESADSTEEKDPKIAKKDSNGHATPPEKVPTASRKSSLNVVVSNEQSGEKAKPTVASESAGNGKLSSKNEPKESQTKTKSEPIENLDAKLASLLGSAKALSPEDPTRKENPSSSRNPPHASTKEGKTNTQQKNVQQQQQSQQQQPNQKNQQQHAPQQQQQQQQQQQPQQSSTVNGGGKKHKKPHHQQAQQQQH